MRNEGHDTTRHDVNFWLFVRTRKEAWKYLIPQIVPKIWIAEQFWVDGGKTVNPEDTDKQNYFNCTFWTNLEDPEGSGWEHSKYWHSLFAKHQCILSVKKISKQL